MTLNSLPWACNHYFREESAIKSAEELGKCDKSGCERKVLVLPPPYWASPLVVMSYILLRSYRFFQELTLFLQKLWLPRLVKMIASFVNFFAIFLAICKPLTCHDNLDKAAFQAGQGGTVEFGQAAKAPR